MKGKLYGLSSTGKVKIWEITPLDDSYVIVHGYVDGKVQTKERPVKGKNIGRSNETSPKEQAKKEAEARWTKQYDKGYRKSVDELDSIPIRAMKLHSYKTDTKDNTHRANYSHKHGVAIQPKLNGIKSIATKVDDTTIKFESRGGKVFDTLNHLVPSLLMLLDVGDVVDGEVYIHGVPLQDISSAVKKENELTPSLEYWIYDVVDLHNSFEDRFGPLITKCSLGSERSYDNIVIVEPMLVINEDEYDILHASAIALGYEGTVLRNMDGSYLAGYRSYDALKRKDFEDSEFTIVDYTSDVNGNVVWVCEVRDGVEFNVVPSGTNEQRVKWFKDGDDYVGKKLTVRYLERSKDGIPQGCPVGKGEPKGEAIRDYE